MKLSILIILKVLCISHGYKILIVCPMTAPSHFRLGNALGRGLVEAGHEVTVVSPFGDKNPPKNYKDVVLTGIVEEKKGKINIFDLENINPLLMAIMINAMGNEVVRGTFSHPNFQKLIDSDEKFDLIILQNFKNDAMNVLQCHFNAPLIIFCITGPSSWVNPLVGNPSPPSYVPDLTLSYASKMNFWERVVNSAVALVNYVTRYLYFIPNQKQLMTQYFPNCTDQDAIINNVSLMFLTSHESSNQPVPLVPNMINIGGFHIKPPKELPTDLKEFMDKAKEGVVYFSLGSNIDPSQMKNETLQTILMVLRKLKEKVLYKYNRDLQDLPDNIKVSKWFPQADILAHPNIKLFITHGGLLSTLETIYHGVPVLALPVFADQKLNAAKAQEAGYGLSIPFSEITEKRLTEALYRLLNDLKYSKNAKTRSALLRDRPVKPMDLAVYWSEFIIRHKGAPHLRIAGADLPLIQYLLLDVIAFVALVSISVIVAIYITCRKICYSGRNKKTKRE